MAAKLSANINYETRRDSKILVYWRSGEFMGQPNMVGMWRR
jgi:hypothetical protein